MKKFLVTFIFVAFIIVACSPEQEQMSSVPSPIPTGTNILFSTSLSFDTATPSLPTRQAKRTQIKQATFVAASQTEMAQETIQSITLAVKVTRNFQYSQTPAPTRTSSPTFTITPTPSAIPTFSSASLPQTYTPAPAALCPNPIAETAPAPDFLSFDRYSWPGDPVEIVLNYLNQYGPKLIVAEHEKLAVQEKTYGSFIFQDLTNDGVPELAMVAKLFYIFGCQDGKYRVYYAQDDIDGYLSSFYVTYFLDGNRNGMPELTILTGWLSQGGHFFKILEWNNGQFRNLVKSDSEEFPEAGSVFVHATGDVSLVDIDHDGIKEFVVNYGLPVWETYRFGIPWRQETDYYKWDGRFYSFYSLEFDEPKYRFQALQDADRFALNGDYDAALDMYQLVIFDDKLDWWSAERRDQEEEEFFNRIGGNSRTPTATLPAPDNDEYFYLTAYARYRIFVLHILRGWADEAQTVYDALQEKFPAGQVGYPFAEMAAAFWNEYQQSQAMEPACSAAISYAAAHPEILYYLGEEHHGFEQSRWYVPEDVCPFK